MELRHHPRIPVDFRVSFAKQDFAGVKVGTMYDLSLGGCAVESTTTVQPGTDLRLSIYAPGKASPIMIESAAVRWAQLGEFGVEFQKIPEQEKDRLQGLLWAAGKASTRGD